MRYRELEWTCICGKAPTGNMTLGLTCEFELVVHWVCEACGKSVYAVKALADCCRECPVLPDDDPGTVTADAEFLRSLGISA